MTSILKRLSGALAAVVFAVAIVAAPSAGALPATTVVTGVVTKGGTPVGGAAVSVECKGHTSSDTTDASGSYLVAFSAGDCPFGSTVKVTAAKGDMSGKASGTVRGETTKLNIAVVNVEIPEYGLLGGLLASGAGIGAIAFIRRRASGSEMSA